MATKVETIYYEIRGDAKALPRDVAVAKAALNGVTREAQGASVGVDGLRNSFKGLAAAAASVKAIQLAKETIVLADSYTTMEARLALVTRDSAELARVQRELFQIAQDAKQPLEGVSELYGRLSRASKELGASQEQVMQFTEGVGNALLVDKVAAAQASGSLLQLSQALGGGVIQAQEFNSLIDGTPRLLQAVADGMDKAHGSVAQLRKMVIAGEVSSKEFFEAFLKGSADLQSEARKMPETVGGAITKLENSFLQFVGTSNKATGTTREIVDAINVLADNLENVAKVGVTLGVVFGGRFLSSGAANVATMAAEQLKQRAATIASAQAAAQAAIVNEAYAEDALRSAAASRQVAEAEVRQAAARLDEVAATQAAIVAERELQTARLNSASAVGARAANQLAQPGLSSLGGAVVAREQDRLADATSKHAAAQRELLNLSNAQRGQAARELTELAAAGKARGQLSEALKVEEAAKRSVTIATQATSAAQAAATRATSLLTGAFSVAARGARIFWTAIGGPIGAVVLGLYAVYSVLKKIEADALAKYNARLAAVQASTDAYAKTLTNLDAKALKAAESQEKLTLAAKGAAAAKTAAALQAEQKVKVPGYDSKAGYAPTAEHDERIKKLTKEHEAAVDEVSKSYGRLAAISGASETRIATTLTTVTTKADEAADKFRDLVKAARDFSDSLNDGDDPIGTMRAKIAALKAEIEQQIPLLKKAQQAAARKDADTVFGQMDTELEQFEMSTLDELNERLQDLNKQLQGDAIDAAGDVFAGLAKEARKLAADYKTASEQATDPYIAQQAQDNAKSALAAADAFDREGAAAIKTAREQKALADAIDIATEARSGSDASIAATAFTLDEYNGAIAFLKDKEAEIKAQLDRGNLSLEERKKIVAELLKIQSTLNGTPIEADSKPTEDTNLLAAALTIASNAAADLSRNLGESGGELARLAEGGLKLVGVFKGIASAQQVVSSKEATSAQELSAKTDIFAFAIGGAIELASAMDLFGTNAKKRAIELRNAAKEFNLALEDFRITERSELENAVRENMKRANDVAVKGLTAAGVKDAKTNYRSVSEIQADIDQYSALAAQYLQSPLKVNQDMGRIFQSMATELQRVVDETESNEKKLQKINDKRNADATNDLRVRELLAQGRTEEANALRDKLALDREIEAASIDQSESGKKYLAYLRSVAKQETETAEAAKRDPLKEFQNRAKLFGIVGGEYLDGLAAASADKFTEIGTAISGLSLNTQDGIDALKQRGKDLYAQFQASDGFVSEAEQNILDALFNIVTAAEDAFDSLTERVNRAMSKLADDNEILGGNARTQFNRTIDASKGFNAMLDGILANVDISSGTGANLLRGRLQSLYVELLRDELTDDEQVIVGLIKGLLNGLSSAVEEAEQEIEAGFASGVNSRAAQRERSRRRAAVTDLDGVAAFTNLLESLSPALSGLFRSVDVSTLDGIELAKRRLRELNDTIEHLSDESALAQFGVTRTELIDAVTELDNSFDALKQSAESAADAALSLANRQRELTESAQDEFLRESGNDRQADLNAAKAATDKRLEEARAAGVSQSVIDQIVKTGQLKLTNINRRYDEQSSTANASRDQAASSSTAASTGSGGAVAFSGAPGGEVRVMTGVLQSSLLVQRRSLELQERLFTIFASGFPALRVPALPPTVGGFVSAGRQMNSGNSGSFTVNFNGDIAVNGTKYSPMDKRQLARDLAPLISQEMRQHASRLTALSGGPR